MITCTKQEVYYFVVPAANTPAFENLPVWVDVDGKDFEDGIPGNAHRGFKIGVDIAGETAGQVMDLKIPRRWTRGLQGVLSEKILSIFLLNSNRH